MIDPLKLLKWALEELNGGEWLETPDHDCETMSAPDRGKCDFCETYWEAVYLAIPDFDEQFFGGEEEDA